MAKRFSQSTGDLPTDEVRDVNLHGGEVWIGTAAGVGRYDGTAWKFYTVHNGLPSDDVRVLAVDSIKSLLWMVTPAGVGLAGRAFLEHPSVSVTCNRFSGQGR